MASVPWLANKCNHWHAKIIAIIITTIRGSKCSQDKQWEDQKTTIDLNKWRKKLQKGVKNLQTIVREKKKTEEKIIILTATCFERG